MKTIKTKKKKILVVDDDPSILSLFTFILTQVGHQTITSSSGRECIEISKSDLKMDLAFIDAKMPDLNSAETFQEFKKHRPTIPCIFMVSYSNKTVTEEILKLRPYATIYKPFDVEEILSIINPLLIPKETWKNDTNRK